MATPSRYLVNRCANILMNSVSHSSCFNTFNVTHYFTMVNGYEDR